MTLFDNDRFPLVTKYTREQRRIKEATYPKCPCGNTLGLVIVGEGGEYCSRCQEGIDEDNLEQTRITCLEDLVDRVDHLIERVDALGEQMESMQGWRSSS